MLKAKTAIMNLRLKSTIQRLRAPFVLLCALCFLTISPLSAAALAINTAGGVFFNTGLVANSNLTLSNGAIDPNWAGGFQAQANSVAGQPFAGWPLPITQNGPNGGTSNGPWVASATSSGTPLSQWISFMANINSTPNTTTTYDYTETFNLSGFTGSTLELIGSFAVDNTILGIFINGTTVFVNGTNSGNYGTSGAKTGFDITNASCSPNCGFTNGTNTITFRTQNIAAASPNPTGLLVEFTSATAQPAGVPEPATLFGVGLGLSVLGLVYRRRRRS